MDLRTVADLEAVLTAIRNADLSAIGVTHLRVGSLEVRFAPRQPGQDLVDALNRNAPMPDAGADPMAAIRQELKQASTTSGVDIIEALASGRRLVTDDDPMRPQG